MTSISQVLDPELYIASLYRGLPVFPVLHNAAEAIPETYPRLGTEVKSVTGAKAFDDHAGIPLPTRAVHWRSMSRREALTMRSWLLARNGRLNPFWVPTFTWDMQFISPFGGSVIITRAYGYSSTLWPSLSRRYLAIYPSGLTTVYFAKVTAAFSAVATLNGQSVTVENLTLDSVPPGMAIGRTRISFLTLCRLASDDFTMKWTGLNSAEVTLNLVEVPHEVPA